MSMDKNCLAVLLLSFSSICFSHSDDDPLLWSSSFNEIEFSENNYLKINNDSWIGKDLNKLWFKTEIERERDETKSAELQLLYTQAIAPNWDIQVGLRKDFEPEPEHAWGVIGVQGLAPYYVEIDTALFLGDQGRVAFRFEAEYEILLTQKLRLTPRLELNFFGQNENLTNTGSGLSNTEFDFRLRYHLRREFAPYIGFNWTSYYGNTAEYRRADNEENSESRWLAGFELWF